MSEYPPITLVMTTWITEPIRKEVAESTLQSWVNNMKYDGELRLHVADDGSTVEWHPETIWKGPISFSRQERRGVGASLNAGFRKAFEVSPLCGYFVDDWICTEEIDLTPWAQLLMEREDVGIVRLGPPHPFMRGSIEIYTTNWQGWALKLERFGLCVGHRPELFHKRFTDFYGMWDENLNACETERLASVRYANMPGGPSIVMALPHKFFHRHSDVVPSLSEIEP